MNEQERDAAFSRAMDEGHDMAWNNQWIRAADAYRRAVDLRPETVPAYTSMGLALLNAGRTEEALRAYLKAEELQPGDPSALAKIAELYVSLKRPDAAASTYLLLADRFMAQRQPGLAVRAWQQAVRHDPANKTALRRLAEAYRRGRRPDFAAQALMALAQVHIKEGQRAQAIACCEQALALKPGFAPARQMIARLQGTGPLTARETMREANVGPAAARAAAAAAAASAARDDGDDDGDDQPQEPQTMSPAEQAAQRALIRMAEAFFEGGDGMDLNIEALKARALDFQTRGLIEEATKTYREILDKGAETPEVLYNLGTLYQEMLRFDDAIAVLERVVREPDYAMGAHFIIGQCYQRQGRTDEALEHFLEAIKIVDLQSVDRTQADDLIKLYAGLADSYEAKGDRDRAAHFTDSLAEFLTNRGWEDKLREMRHRLGTIFSQGETITLAELLEATESEEAIQAMALSQEYLDRGLYNSAIDECYWAIRFAPNYLPLHLRLADLFARSNKIDAAVDKQVMVADLYLWRGNHTKAINCYQNALELAPLDQNVRSKLIDLAISHGNIDLALDSYVALADGFYQLAQGDRAIEKLNEALRLAPRGAPERQWAIELQRRLADIHLQRLDWRRAAVALEAVLALAPHDTEVGQRLLDLYHKLGREDDARRTLTEISNALTKRGEQQAATRLWRSHLESRPDDIELHRLAGEQLMALGDVEGTCLAWEPLVDQFINNGQASHAMALLRKMIGLKPTNMEKYRRQLSALMPGR